MCGILFGKEFVQENTVMTSLININSPMTFDDVMMGALEVYAANNQACIISPFIVGGAMAPVSVAGTLTQVLAEVLAGIAYSPAGAPGRACDLRGFCDLDRYELRRADVRHTRSEPYHLWRRAAWPAAWVCRSAPRGRSVDRNFQMHRRPMKRPTPQHGLAVGRELYVARVWLA